MAVGNARPECCPSPACLQLPNLEEVWWVSALVRAQMPVLLAAPLYDLRSSAATPPEPLLTCPPTSAMLQGSATSLLYCTIALVLGAPCWGCRQAAGGSMEAQGGPHSTAAAAYAMPAMPALPLDSTHISSLLQAASTPTPTRAAWAAPVACPPPTRHLEC